MQCQRSPNSNTAHLTGCLDKGVNAVNDQAAIVGGVGIGIAFVMVSLRNEICPTIFIIIITIISFSCWG